MLTTRWHSGRWDPQTRSPGILRRRGFRVRDGDALAGESLAERDVYFKTVTRCTSSIVAVSTFTK
jgi:hypothetical protein